MGKNQSGLSFLILLFSVTIIAFLVVAGWALFGRHEQKKPTISSNPHQSVITAADNYLISKVGSTDFHKYYTFDAGKSSFVSPSESPYDFIGYHFAPIKGMKENDIIRVQVNRNTSMVVDAPGVPDCTKNASFCNFNIDKSKALQIAGQNSVTATDRTVFWQTGLESENKKAGGLGYVVVVHSCSQNKSLFIDYRDGSIMWTEDNCGDED